MTDWRRCLIAEDAPIEEALSAIDESSLQIALVVDDEQRLVGVVTDGDVRRGILEGVGLDDRVDRIMNDSPTTVPTGESPENVLGLMKRKKLHQVPVVDGEGRVVDLQVVDELLSPPTRDNPVVLLAGGLGSRLRPVTEERPKPLVEVGNRPILETILETLIDQGFHQFHLSVNYKAEMIEEYFGDGSEWGVDIRYLRENQRLGTAGPLGLLPERPSLPLVVMNGDLLTKLDFNQLLEYHRDHEGSATMCVRDYDIQVPFGVVETEEHRIVGVEEKPTERYFINAGIYVFEPEVLELVPEDEHLDMTELFAKLTREDGTPAVFPIREYWMDVGRPSDLEKAGEEYEDVF